MSQNGPKTTSLMTSLTKNPQHPTKKIFFEFIQMYHSFPTQSVGGAMVLVRQPKTAGFRPKSRYDIFVDQFSKC